MSIRAAVIEEITRIGKQQNKTLAPLSDTLPLLNSGLDSLCIAVLVASLDDRLGIDPFASDLDAPFPVTIGDFVALYENASV
jgi:hypothetical protein